MRAFLVILALLSGLAHAQELEFVSLPQPDGSLIVILPPDAVKVCQEKGGCRIATGDEMQAFAADVAAQAVKHYCGRDT